MPTRTIESRLTVRQCQCPHTTCETYGFKEGTFYQGENTQCMAIERSTALYERLLEVIMHGECDICGSCEHVRHINLYVSGSEGLTVCTECEMHIVTYVRSLRQIAAKAKLRMVKFYKDQQERLKKVEP